MFSGIITEIGKITLNQGKRIDIVKGTKAKAGDSIAVNGVCLTVVTAKKVGKRFQVRFDLSEETLAKTTLGAFPLGSGVNLESSLALSASLGGHIVQGHVDGVGRVVKVISQKEGMKTIWFEAPAEVAQFLVEKGSVAIDGISLTVVNLTKTRFSVAFIPFTLENTNAGQMKPGDRVNMEADVIGKYVMKYMKR
jgi:riboflavin synthase